MKHMDCGFPDTNTRVRWQHVLAQTMLIDRKTTGPTPMDELCRAAGINHSALVPAS